MEGERYGGSGGGEVWRKWRGRCVEGERYEELSGGGEVWRGRGMEEVEGERYGRSGGGEVWRKGRKRRGRGMEEGEEEEGERYGGRYAYIEERVEEEE